MRIGQLLIDAAHLGKRAVSAIAVGAREVWSAIKYIIFKDPVVEQICVANFSSDGVGVTEEDAAKVTNIGMKFRANTEITSFDEFEKFTSIKVLGSLVHHTESAFTSCTNLQSIKYPLSLRTVGRWNFKGCTSLRTTIPEYIEELYDDAFSDVPLEGEIYLPNLRRLDANAVTSKMITHILDLGVIPSLPNGFMALNGNLISCKIPRSVTKLGSGCFQQCSKLEDIGTDLSHVVTVTGNQALWYCGRLKFHANLENLESTAQHLLGASGVLSIRFGKLVTIPSYVAYSCPNLTKVEIPSVTTSIGYSFHGCAYLTEVIVHAVAPPTLTSGAFSNAHSSMTIYVPDESVEAYKTASNWSTFADKMKPLSQYVES